MRWVPNPVAVWLLCCRCRYTAADSTVHRIVLVAYEADDEDASVPAGLEVFRVVDE